MKTEQEVRERLKALDDRFREPDGINYNDGIDESEYAEMMTLAWVLGEDGY